MFMKVAFAFKMAFDFYIIWPIIHLFLLTGTFTKVFFFSFIIEFSGITLVDKIIQVSGGQF